MRGLEAMTAKRWPTLELARGPGCFLFAALRGDGLVFAGRRRLQPEITARARLYIQASMVQASGRVNIDDKSADVRAAWMDREWTASR